MSLEGLLIAVIVLFSIFIAGSIIFAWYLWNPLTKRVKYNIRAELRARNRRQKTIEKKFNEELRKNVLPTITDNPAMIENFPETISLGEQYNEETFAGMKILSTFVIPVVRTLAGYMVPQTEGQANLQKGVQLATEPTLLNVAMQFLPQLLKNAGQNKPASKAIPKKTYNTTIENV